jgi:hypothetical protein
MKMNKRKQLIWLVSVLESSAKTKHNGPPLRLTVKGLKPQADYEVFGFFWATGFGKTNKLAESLHWPARFGLGMASITTFRSKPKSLSQKKTCAADHIIKSGHIVPIKFNNDLTMIIRIKRKTSFMLFALLGLVASQAMGLEPRRSEDALEKERRLALQAKYKDMPEVELNLVKEDVKFQIVDMRKSLLEVNGSKYCAFRFKTSDKVHQLTWVCRFPPGIKGWYILPEKGRMEGFNHFRKFTLSHDRGDKGGWGSKGDFFFVQSLSSRHFEPNTGYIIWFGIKDAADSAINLSLNMTPVPDGSPYSAVFPSITL